MAFASHGNVVLSASPFAMDEDGRQVVLALVPKFAVGTTRDGFQAT
jgi:hypothetical protein